MVLVFQWFQESKPVGPELRVVLQDGDMYAMSEKATGCDWKKRSGLTLRHAAGADKFIVIKSKAKKPKKEKEVKQKTEIKKSKTTTPDGATIRSRGGGSKSSSKSSSKIKPVKENLFGKE